MPVPPMRFSSRLAVALARALPAGFAAAALGGCWENSVAPLGGPVRGRIAYQSTREGVNGLALTSGDGGASADLSASGEGKPEWSPDGLLLVFQRENRGTYTDIWVMVPNGGDAVQVTNTPALSERDPTWAPEGNRIAYSATFFTEGVGAADSIVVSTPDGKGRSALTRGLDPSWGPDGRIAFVDAANGGGTPPAIWVIEVAGQRTRVSPAAPGTLAELEPSWSASGRLAWTRRRTVTRADGTLRDEWSIMVQPFPDAPAVAIVTDSAVVRAPAWSPDDDELAVTAAWDGTPEVWAVRADGTGRRRITTSSRCGRAPCGNGHASWSR
jgi:Tol biopolymer transport system component